MCALTWMCRDEVTSRVARVLLSCARGFGDEPEALNVARPSTPA